MIRRAIDHACVFVMLLAFAFVATACATPRVIAALPIVGSVLFQ